MTEEKKPTVWGNAQDPNNEDCFVGCFATREEAIADGKDAYEGEEFWVLEGAYPDVALACPGFALLFERLMEDIAEKAEGDLGWAYLDGWPQADDEARSELLASFEEVTKAWMRKHLEPPMWEPVGKPERIPGEVVT